MGTRRLDIMTEKCDELTAFWKHSYEEKYL